MKRFTICILAVMFIPTLTIADQSTATTAPVNPTTAQVNPLVGRWRVVSIGRGKPAGGPDNNQLFWSFDERNVVVTVGKDAVTTKSQYSLRRDGEHQVISLYEGSKGDITH